MKCRRPVFHFLLWNIDFSHLAIVPAFCSGSARGVVVDAGCGPDEHLAVRRDGAERCDLDNFAEVRIEGCSGILDLVAPSLIAVAVSHA